MHVDASNVVVPLPRVGLNFLLEPTLISQVTWRGAGPHESYPDRKSSTVQSLHTTHVDNLAVPYIVPGESGSHTDTQWLLLGPDTTTELGGANLTTSAASRPRSRSSSFAASNATANVASSAAALNNPIPVSIHSQHSSLSTSTATTPAMVAAGVVPETPQTPMKATNSSSNLEGYNNTTSTRSRSSSSSSNQETLVRPVLTCNTSSAGVASSANSSLPSTPKSYGPGGKPRNKPAMRIASRNGTTFNYSILPYTVEDLAQAAHFSTLEYFPRPFYSLNLDPFIMGLGGDDNVAASVQDDHMLPPDEYKFEFVFNFFDDI